MKDHNRVDYTLLPEHMRPGAQRWIENGITPGNFLTAVICNDLVESFGTADGINFYRVSDFVDFFYNEAPSQCWGSVKKMKAWKEMHEERKKV